MKGSKENISQSVSCSAVSDSLRLHGLQPARLLCPWNFPGKNIGVGCYSLLHGIFPPQGSNLHLQHWQKDSLPLSHQGRLILSLGLSVSLFPKVTIILTPNTAQFSPCFRTSCKWNHIVPTRQCLVPFIQYCL